MLAGVLLTWGMIGMILVCRCTGQRRQPISDWSEMVLDA